MIWVFVVVAALVVFAIAAAFVGSEAFRLGHQPRAAVFDLDEAVDHVADRLPSEAQARLTYDEVRQLIRAALAHFEGKGLSAGPGLEPTAPDDEAVVVADDDTVAVVLGAADEQGIDTTDEDVHRVVTLLLGYLDEIGALGPRA
ncbi:MAG: hypothetical protein AB7L84_08980 [Acidimicrobiia bacterium]